MAAGHAEAWAAVERRCAEVAAHVQDGFDRRRYEKNCCGVGGRHLSHGAWPT